MTFPAKNISVSINRSQSDVYKFMANPLNLPLWAQGLANSKLLHSGDEWITDSPMGKVKVKFAPDNSFGVLDHDVTLPSGEMSHNPLRVVKNSNGSEVIFTLYRRPQMTDGEFKKDADSIEKDLMKHKSLLEIDKS